MSEIKGLGKVLAPSTLRVLDLADDNIDLTIIPF